MFGHINAFTREEEKFEVNKAYDVEHPIYGKLGLATCTSAYTTTLLELRPLTIMMMEGNQPNYINSLHIRGFKNHSQVQVCSFVFTLRYAENMNKMMLEETKKAGFPLTIQPSLFS